MCLGRYDLNHIYRIFVKFPITSIPEEANIIEAYFKMCVAAVGFAQPNKVTPYAVTEAWTQDTVTWDNQPAFSTTILSEGMNIRKSGQYVFDITEIVQKWYKDKVVNYGLILKNNEIKDGTFAKVLTDITTDFAPVVEIKYILKCKCVCECKVVSTEFIEDEEEINTRDRYSYLLTQNTSLNKTITYFVKNIGSSDVTAKLQISPNGVDFKDDNGNVIIGPNEMAAIIPYCFAKFTRMAVKTVNKMEVSTVKVWYQAQK
jgi:hypothetical protein